MESVWSSAGTSGKIVVWFSGWDMGRGKMKETDRQLLLHKIGVLSSVGMSDTRPLKYSFSEEKYPIFTHSASFFSSEYIRGV